MEGENQVTVKNRRINPDSGANADLPRTINDAQPYYIFDRETIERSGAIDMEDFLKQRLTMNAVAKTNGQAAEDLGRRLVGGVLGAGLYALVGF